MPRRHSHTTASAAAAAALTESKQVNFDPMQDEIHCIDLIHDDDVDRVFYTRSQIKELQREEMTQIKQAILKDKFQDYDWGEEQKSESSTFTWRGVEDWKNGQPCPVSGRQAKVAKHVKHVLDEWKKQDMFGPTVFGETVDLQERWDAIRVVSKTSSKEARANALKKATSDAQAAGVRRSNSAAAAGKMLLKGVMNHANPLKLMRASLGTNAATTMTAAPTSRLALNKDSRHVVASATA